MTPEYIIEICVAIDIAILSISYPIIVDKISNIGDKYSSQYIPVIFNTEFPEKRVPIRINKKEYKISIFKLTLFTTLFSLFFLIFQFQPLFGWDNWVINNSAKYLVLFLSTILTVFFFTWLDKAALYNGKSKSLLVHIINKYDSIKDDIENKQYHLKAINELTFYALQKQDEHLQETLLEFYYRVINNIRKNQNNNEPLIYPIDIYFLVNKLTIESVNIENKKLRAIEHRAVSGAWLLGEDFEEIQISEETYNWLWRNIYTICDNPRLVKMFWANSSQYCNFKLKKEYPEYNFEHGGIINQKDINKRDFERNQFIEFHYALGGLIYYRKQYNLLKYLFEYTQSEPPAYALLPETMSDIFYWVENFSNEFKNRKIPIDSKYYFPELDNLGNSRQVNYWICSYISILFIRQYSLHQYYTFQDFTALPKLPDDILELSSWLDSVSFFERCLNDILINTELIKVLGYNKIVEVNQGDFKIFINKLTESIRDKIGKQKFDAQLSAEKINSFYIKSNNIITGAFKEYDSIFTATTDDSFPESELKLSINGAKTLMSKSAFTDGDLSGFNYDSVFAEIIVMNKIKRIIPYSFNIAKTKRYLLNKENILLSIDKLIGNKQDIIIIGFNIGFQLRRILEECSFRNQVKYVPSTDNHSQDILYILRKSYLPIIEHKEIIDEEPELKLLPINNELKIYASVIDINKEENKSIKDKWHLEITDDNLDLKVQIAISFLSVIYWKDNREIIQISIASEFREQGIQNDINDIESLK